jgi:hypothetical protein
VVLDAVYTQHKQTYIVKQYRSVLRVPFVMKQGGPVLQADSACTCAAVGAAAAAAAAARICIAVSACSFSVCLGEQATAGEQRC